MKGWIRTNLGALVAVTALAAGGLTAWGRMSQICAAVGNKADKESVIREFDQVHDQLERINEKLDRLLFNNHQQ